MNSRALLLCAIAVFAPSLLMLTCTETLTPSPYDNYDNAVLNITADEPADTLHDGEEYTFTVIGEVVNLIDSANIYISSDSGASYDLVKTFSNPSDLEKRQEVTCTFPRPGKAIIKGVVFRGNGEAYADSIIVTVHGRAVTIISQPAALVAIPVGDTLRLGCKAGGSPDIAYQWFQGNKKLDVENAESLIVANAQLTNSGKYICEIKNAYGPSAVTDTAHVLVEKNHAPSVTVSGPSIVSVGMICTLTMSITDPDPDQTHSLSGSFATTLHGSRIADDSLIVWAPDTSDTGSHNATCIVTDNGLKPLSDTAQIELFVRMPGAPPPLPVAMPDSFAAMIGEDLIIPAQQGVLANDSLSRGAAHLEAALVDGPTSGSLTLQPDGSFTYVTDLELPGSDQFTYQAVDDNGKESGIAAVKLTIIRSQNRKPIAAPDVYESEEDSVLSVNAAQGVLANDSDPNSNDVLQAVLVAEPKQGTLVLSPSGSFEYTPDQDFFGADTFTYQARDASDALSDEIVPVAVHIAAVADAPVAANDSYSIRQGGMLQITDAATGVLKNDTDADGDEMRARLADSADHGAVTFNGDGTFSYQPDEDWFVGIDKFTYVAFDEDSLTSSAATVAIEVISDSVPITIAFQRPDTSVSETHGDYSLLVSLNAAASRVITADYQIGGSAQRTSDFSGAASGQVVFNIGEQVKEISLSIVDDTVHEDDESIIIELVNISSPAAAGDPSTHTITILDDELPAVFFSTENSQIDEDGGAAVIPVALAFAPRESATVTYRIVNNTADREKDLSAPAQGFVRFSAADTLKNISINLVDDPFKESDETFQVVLSAPSLATLGADSVHTVTVIDNDELPRIAFRDAASTGEEALTSLSLPVVLSSRSETEATVKVTVTGGTATGGGNDFRLLDTLLTFASLDTIEHVGVTIVNDGVNEPAETIILSLSTPANATLGDPFTHTYTIKGASSTPEISFQSASSEGDESNDAPSVAVNLSMSWSQEVSVDYEVDAAASSAQSGDYTLGRGTLVFAPGETQKSFTLAVTGDSRDEERESVVIRLSSERNATLGTQRTFTYYIIDDDPAPIVRFVRPAVSYVEGVGTIRLPIALSRISEKNPTIQYELKSAASPSDFEFSSGAIVFGTDTLAEIPFTVLEDEISEGDEIARVRMTSPTDMTIGPDSVCAITIQDNNGNPIVSFKSAATSADESVLSIDAIVKLDRVSSSQVSVEWSIDEAATSAIGDGVDYETISKPSPLVFPAGDTLDTISITVVDDALDEEDKTISLRLITDAEVNDGANMRFTHTIRDDDDPPTVSFSAARTSAKESVSPGKIELALSSVSRKPITVPFELSGSAAAEDYSLLGLSYNSITIAPNRSKDTIELNIFSDDGYEKPDSIVFTLSDGIENGVRGSQYTHVYTIEGDTHSVTVEGIGNGAVSPNGERRVAHGQSITITADPDDNNSFKSWSTTSGITMQSESGTDPVEASFAVVQPGEIRAAFAIDTMIVTMIMGANGSQVVPAAGPVKVPYGTTLAIEAVAADNYHFDGWTATSGLQVADPAQAVTSLEPVTVDGGSVTANFAIDQYTITVSDDGHGTTTLAGDQLVDWDGELPIQAIADACHEFDKWVVSGTFTIDDATDSTTTIRGVRSAGTVQATFTRLQYEVTVDDGSGAPAQTEVVNCGDNLPITATPPGTGYSFDVWTKTGCGQGSSIENQSSETSNVLNVTNAGSVTASYSPIAPSGSNIICVDADATGHGTGENWADAFTTIQAAVAASNAGDTIWVAEGTYIADPTIEPISETALIGGFNGTEKLAIQRDSVANHTCITGDKGTGEFARTLINIDGQSNVLINCFIIERSDNGKGIKCYGGAGLTFKMCVIQKHSNSAASMQVFFTKDILIDRCVFAYNRGIVGALNFADYSKATGKIVNTIFYKDTTKDGAGAILVGKSDTVDIYSSLLVSNYSEPTTSTAGIINKGHTKIYNSIFWNNTSPGEYTVADMDTNNVIKYSCIDSARIGRINKAYSGWHASNIVANPQFVNIESPLSEQGASWYNYKCGLRATSDLIQDEALPYPEVPIDITGWQRGSPLIEMGAYETR